MKLQELYKHYGNWTAVSMELKITMSGLQYWRKRGYIPYPKQLVIEKQTNGLFKAHQEDAKPTKE